MADSKGSTLGAIALIIALGASGLGVYQMFFAPLQLLLQNGRILSYWTLRDGKQYQLI